MKAYLDIEHDRLRSQSLMVVQTDAYGRGQRIDEHPQ